MCKKIAVIVSEAFDISDKSYFLSLLIIEYVRPSLFKFLIDNLHIRDESLCDVQLAEMLLAEIPELLVFPIFLAHRDVSMTNEIPYLLVPLEFRIVLDVLDACDHSVCRMPEKSICHIYPASLCVPICHTHIDESHVDDVVLVFRVGIRKPHGIHHKLFDRLPDASYIKHLAIRLPHLIPFSSVAVEEIIPRFCHTSAAFLKNRIIEFHAGIIPCESVKEGTCEVSVVSVLDSTTLAFPCSFVSFAVLPQVLKECLHRMIDESVRQILFGHLLDYSFIILKCFRRIVIDVFMSFLAHRLVFRRNAVPYVRILRRILVVDVLNLIG